METTSSPSASANRSAVHWLFPVPLKYKIMDVSSYNGII